jgi:phosphoserine phosphatase RsbU/P
VNGATLEVLEGTQKGKIHRIDREETIIGRLPYCDVSIPERNVSRQHARVVRTRGQYYLEDMNSTNGTYLNNRRLLTRTRLKDSDIVRVYNVPLLFQLEAQVLAPAPPAGPEPSPPSLSTTHPAAGGVVTGPAEPPGTVPGEDTRGVGLNVYDKLRVVLQIHRKIGRTLNVEEVLPKILDGLFSVFPQSDRGYILLPEGDLGPLVVKAHKHKEEGTLLATTLGPISKTVAERVLSRGEALLLADGLGGADFNISDSVLDFPIRSMMCAPLIGPRERPLGIIYVDTSDARERFHEDDLEVLVSVAATAGQAMEYAHAHEARMRLVRRERELAMAKQIQLHFLPQSRPGVAGYRFFHHYSAAEEVGGDYYEFIPLPDGRMAVAVADVSGKGMWAALIMARLCSEVRFRLVTCASFIQAFDELNQEFCRPENEAWFVTFLLCILDPRTHEIMLLNAGHMPPFCRRAASDTVEELGHAQSGPPLGCLPTITYEPFTTRLEPGDSLVMFTDGINEAMNASLDAYGLHRLRQAFKAAPAPLEALCQSLLEDVARFVLQQPQSDDICLVGLQRE